MARICISLDYYLCDVELGLLEGEDVLLDEQVHQVASRQVLHHQVQEVLVLEGALQVHDPLVVRLRQDRPLRPDVLDLVLLYHIFLLHFLDCHQFAIGQPLAQPNLTVGASANYLDRLEVLD